LTEAAAAAIVIFVSFNRGRAANLITDVPGIRVGHAEDARIASGATVVLFDKPATASIAVHGGAPGRQYR